MASSCAHSIFIAVHYQNDILHPDSKFHVGVAQVSDRRTNVIAAAHRLLESARKHRIPIIHARIAFAADHANLVANCTLFRKVKAAGVLLDGSWGAEFYAGFAPLLGEGVVTHTRNNAFYKTSLESLIGEQGASHLIIAGIATNYAVEHTARHAVDLGYVVTVVSDASTTADLALHEASLRSLALLADVKSTDEVVEGFASVGSPA